MDEEDLILKGLEKAALPGGPSVSVVTKPPEIDPSPLPFMEVKDDAFRKLVKKEAKRKKRKNKRKNNPISQWTTYDFMNDLSSVLSVHSVELIRRSLPKDSSALHTLYDKFVHKLGERVNNYMIREYFQWWASIFALSFQGMSITVDRLAYDSYIKQYVDRVSDPMYILDSHRPPGQLDEDPDVTEKREPSGDPVLDYLIEHGIVAAHQCYQKDDNTMSIISDALSLASREGIYQIMQRTLEQSPYPKSHTVDFVSLSRKALTFHGYDALLQLDYADYFSEV